VRELRLALTDGTKVAAALHPAAVPGARAGGADGDRAPVLLLPGARGDHAAAHLVALAEMLAAAGHAVVRAALTSRPPGAGVVGPAERSVGRMRDVLTAARALVAGSAGAGAEDATDGWIVGGASYGGRVASLAVAEHGGAALGAVGLLLVAYPLHPPGRPDRLRVAHFGAIDVPVLMLSGDADPFLTMALLDEHASALGAPLTRLIVPGGRHDLSVSARSAPDGQRRSPAAAVAEVAQPLVAWAARC
jgi:predicted alpha/beta-hydrolase family hydrolase